MMMVFLLPFGERQFKVNSLRGYLIVQVGTVV